MNGIIIIVVLCCRYYSTFRCLDDAVVSEKNGYRFLFKSSSRSLVTLINGSCFFFFYINYERNRDMSYLFCSKYETNFFFNMQLGFSGRVRKDNFLNWG